MITSTGGRSAFSLIIAILLAQRRSFYYLSLQYSKWMGAGSSSLHSIPTPFRASAAPETVTHAPVCLSSPNTLFVRVPQHFVNKLHMWRRNDLSCVAYMTGFTVEFIDINTYETTRNSVSDEPMLVCIVVVSFISRNISRK